jgi:hypothetical protein
LKQPLVFSTARTGFCLYSIIRSIFYIVYNQVMPATQEEPEIKNDREQVVLFLCKRNKKRQENVRAITQQALF